MGPNGKLHCGADRLKVYDCMWTLWSGFTGFFISPSEFVPYFNIIITLSLNGTKNVDCYWTMTRPVGYLTKRSNFCSIGTVACAHFHCACLPLFGPSNQLIINNNNNNNNNFIRMTQRLAAYRGVSRIEG